MKNRELAVRNKKLKARGRELKANRGLGEELDEEWCPRRLVEELFDA